MASRKPAHYHKISRSNGSSHLEMSQPLPQAKPNTLKRSLHLPQDSRRPGQPPRPHADPDSPTGISEGEPCPAEEDGKAEEPKTPRPARPSAKHRAPSASACRDGRVESTGPKAAELRAFEDVIFWGVMSPTKNIKCEYISGLL